MNAREMYRALRAQGKGRKKALRLIGCAALLSGDSQDLRAPKGRRAIERTLAEADASIPAGRKSRRKILRETRRQGVLLSGAL